MFNALQSLTPKMDNPELKIKTPPTMETSVISSGEMNPESSPADR